jgi:hypothetical protein
MPGPILREILNGLAEAHAAALPTVDAVQYLADARPFCKPP